jgi:acyl-CoA thioesterase
MDCETHTRGGGKRTKYGDDVGIAFDQDTALLRKEEGLFEGHIDDRWWVNRGPHGGFLAALLMRALTESIDDGRRAARSFTTHFVAPPERGPVLISTRLERVGRSRSSISARMEQNGATVALALAAFSKPWTSVEYSDVTMPGVPRPQDAPKIEPQEVTPAFFLNFDARWAVGDPPFSNSERAVSGGWIRLVEPRVIEPIALAALADAWIPSVFSKMSRPVPVPTVDLTVHFRRALPLPDASSDDYLLTIFKSPIVADGFFVEDGEIWSERGELVAQSRQLAVLMGGEETA